MYEPSVTGVPSWLTLSQIPSNSGLMRRGGRDWECRRHGGDTIAIVDSSLKWTAVCRKWFELKWRPLRMLSAHVGVKRVLCLANSTSKTYTPVCSCMTCTARDEGDVLEIWYCFRSLAITLGQEEYSRLPHIDRECRFTTVDKTTHCVLEFTFSPIGVQYYTTTASTEANRTFHCMMLMKVARN